VLLMVAGLQVPEMPLGEVAFNVGAVVPVHKESVEEKLGTVAVATEKVTLSETVAPQAFVAVKLS
jgi:hypothetical protein